jgi:integrase/recombinase XerD
LVNPRFATKVDPHNEIPPYRRPIVDGVRFRTEGGRGGGGEAMLEWLSSFPKTSARLTASPLCELVSSYLIRLTEQRYSTKTMRKYADQLLWFGDYLAKRECRAAAEFPQMVEPFLADLADRLPPAAHVRPTINCFLRHLRENGVIPAIERDGPLPPHAKLIEEYCTFLRTLRALKERTLRKIQSNCRKFVNFAACDDEAKLRSLDPETIHRYLVFRGRRCGRLSLSTECSCLRGFLAYLHRCEMTTADLSRVVVSPRIYQHDRCPRYLTRAQVDAVLAVVDRSKPVGRRDYAMLTLLAAYGLRGSEAARLRLEDVDWRNSKLHIRERKAGNSTTYPLARSVEIAIIEYLRNGRPPSPHRQVFLSAIAPFRPLVTGFALASHIGKYLEQAGIEVETPGTHIFRYSCAQRLFEAGTPLKVIGDYLGHADLQSTLRYTKIAIDQLREVALDDGDSTP